MKRLIPIMLLLICKITIGQFPEWECHHKVNEVNTIAESGDFIWVGTFVGAVSLNKISGEIMRYSVCNTPFMNHGIKKIAADNSGAVWMSTCEEGILMRYTYGEWTVFDSTNSDLPGTNITDITFDDDNNLWFVCQGSNNGLWKFDGNSCVNYLVSNSGIPTNKINAIEAEGNNVWLCSYKRLTKFDGTDFFVWDPNNSNIRQVNGIDIDADNAGNVWTVSSEAIEKFDGTTFKYMSHANSFLPKIHLTALSIDQNNILWVSGKDLFENGTLAGGIFSYNGTSITFYDPRYNPEMSDSEMYSILAGTDNSIWYGAFLNGTVGKKEADNWVTYNTSDTELNHKEIRHLVNDYDGSAIFGTAKGPASKLSWYWTEIPHYSSLSHGIATDTNSNIYIKNQDGIMKYDGVSWNAIPNTPLLNSHLTPWHDPLLITSDKSNNLWIDYLYWLEHVYNPQTGGTDYYTHEGLACYNGTEWIRYNEGNSPLPSTINDIEFNSLGHVVVATNKGIYIYDGTEWIVYKPDNSSLPFNNIAKIAIDSLDRIWFSSNFQQLYCFDGYNLDHYPNPGQNIGTAKDIIIDKKGIIWMAGTRILIEFDGTNFYTYNHNNSPLFPYSLTAISCDIYNNLWIGTQYGFLLFNKEGIITSAKHYPKWKESALTIFPNPATSHLNIKFDKNYPELTLSIYNVLSQAVHTVKPGNNSEIEVSLNDLSKGIYFITAVSENRTIGSGKFIKQ